MVKFPNVLPIVRPLYTCDSSSRPTLKKQRSLEAWKNNTVAPLTRCHSEDASTTSNFQTSTSNTLDNNYNTEKVSLLLFNQKFNKLLNKHKRNITNKYADIYVYKT